MYKSHRKPRISQERPGETRLPKEPKEIQVHRLRQKSGISQESPGEIRLYKSKVSKMSDRAKAYFKRILEKVSTIPTNKTFIYTECIICHNLLGDIEQKRGFCESCAGQDRPEELLDLKQEMDEYWNRICENMSAQRHQSETNTLKMMGKMTVVLMKKNR